MKNNIFNKNNNIKCLAIAATALLTVSCDDYLTITPSNQIVEEDFWADRNDLNNMVSACYTQYNNMVSDIMLWGEVRGDNFILNDNGRSNTQYRNIMNANLMCNYNLFKWEKLYKEINYCNKVLVHGPEIIERDESFIDADWQPIRAEILTLRALAHFYLTRIWKDIPYITTDYNNSEQNFIVEQTPQIQVLDNIIKDLNIAESNAMEEFSNSVWNCGRITKDAVRAILADVHLWRASLAANSNQKEDCDKCIEYCNKIINHKLQVRAKYLIDDAYVLGEPSVEALQKKLTIENLLIPNVIDIKNSEYETEIYAYNNVFGEGNSRESIFELQFDGIINSNGINGNFYDLQKSSINTFVGPENTVSEINTKPNDFYPQYVFTKTDYRRWETFLHSKSGDQQVYPIYKFAYETVKQIQKNADMMTDNTLSSLSHTYSSVSNSAVQKNWPIYRIADVFLMKAEAISQVCADTDTIRLKEGFDLCRALFKRSNPYAYSPANLTSKDDSLDFKYFISKEGLEALVMGERQRELYAEGKRWFDLVRYAQRKNSTTSMIKNFLGRKYTENRSAIISKLSTIESLYSPIHKDETKVNNLLKQNKIWDQEESISKTDNL